MLSLDIADLDYHLQVGHPITYGEYNEEDHHGGTTVDGARFPRRLLLAGALARWGTWPWLAPAAGQI